ncbi:BPL-N domain-containing protein [Rhodococcus sp. UNC363MFTsu5.1]|uniref:BPL-N domain-containing protein n=1 Tax=Rhodococcus sp. UNC363MFTsu5.1 TaxID=1449069 RepID=UPI000AEEB65F|nr:BPL-N domain-containing protein [Rhodococcus sp. UNC363MFTsu5.1]
MSRTAGRVTRRRFLIGAAGAGAIGAAAAVGLPRLLGDDRPVALVYRGPATCAGCAESVARLLESAPTPLRPVYCGPDEEVDVTPESLAGATLYAQPGGGTLDPAWRRVRGYAPHLREWVASGGTYLGFCLGAYLAGADPGYNLFPGRVRQYIGTDEATVDDTEDTVVEVTWRDERRHLFFQDGAVFRVPGDDWGAIGATVLARYPNDTVAAVVSPYGSGRVGLVGPHPEADESWYSGPGLVNPDGIRYDLGHDLVASALQR